MNSQEKEPKKEILCMHNVCLGTSENYLKDFRLRVCKGELIELLGITGAGKTALYRYLTGNEVLKKGSVVFQGRLYHPTERFEDTKEVICVGEQSSLLPGLSVAENICIITQKRKVSRIINRKAINYRVNLLLKQYVRGVEPDALAGSLTLPERHLVEMLRAVENEVELIYLDDIFGTYGQIDMLRVTHFMEALKEKGITVISAKRGKSVFESLTDRAIVLRDGQNVKTFYKVDYKEETFQEWMSGRTDQGIYQRHSSIQKEVVFQARNISCKSYIDQFSMKVHKGEIVGFYDMNNYANIEVIRILTGEVELLQGSMELNGKNYRPKSMEDVIKHNAGYISTMHNGSGLVDALGFAENLMLPVMLKMSLYGFLMNKRVNNYLQKEYLDLIGVDKENQYGRVSRYDIYTKTKIILYKWILAKPDLLICREICDEADVKLRNIIFEALAQMAEDGTAIVLSSHNIGELKSICDTIYLMNSSENHKAVENIQVVKDNPLF
jgi:ABC-type sugar transport system ATPase subunit